MKAIPLDALHRERLTRMASVVVEVGVNLQPGQELIVTAPLEAQDLVEALSGAAYRRGARLVTCLYDDPALLLQRLTLERDDVLDATADWLSAGVVQALKGGAARVFVVAPYPDLLAGVAPGKMLRVHAAVARAGAEEARFTAESVVNWSTVPYATRSWSRTVFPDRPDEVAQAALWEQLFEVMRCVQPDAPTAWRRHCDDLDRRRAALQLLELDALRLRGGGTELEVGLVAGHRWVGGTVMANNGVACVCNMPTEEIFTCPHRDRIDGRIVFTRPLVVGGTRISGLHAEFRRGQLVSLSADEGLALARQLLESDEGASRLGEIGLVNVDSPVARTGTQFLNPLLDENAASHVAFGQSYAVCAGTASEGANQSNIHIDAMFGHDELEVTGIAVGGNEVPIMRSGRFVV